MDLGSILSITALFILVVIFVIRPFLDKDIQPGEESEIIVDSQLSSLLAERDRIINALQELDFDANLGKIPAEEYPIQRKILMQQGVKILRQIDSLSDDTLPDHVAAVAPEQFIQADSAENRIEEIVVTGRADSSSQMQTNPVEFNSTQGKQIGETISGEMNPEEEIETMIANRRRVRNGKASGFCPQCGGPTQQTDHFCPKCGKRLI
jgi:hypothetical protein